MKRTLSDSQEGSSSKRLRRSGGCLPDFHGFSDEQSVRFNTLKVQNAELFCKKMQQTNEIERNRTQLHLHQDRTRKYQQRLGLIEHVWQKMLEKLGFQDQTPSLAQSQSSFLQQMSELVTKIPTGRDQTKKQFSKFAQDLENKLLFFISSYEKERTQWEATRAALSPELAQESQHLSQQLNLLIAGQYERIIQTLSYEQKISALREQQSESRPLHDQLCQTKRLLEHQQKQNDQLEKLSEPSHTNNETPEPVEQTPATPAPEAPVDVSLKFECSQVEASIQSWQNILKNRQQIVEEMKAEKDSLEKEFAELVEKHEPNQGPSLDLIKSSASYHLLDRQNACAEPEIASWKKQIESLTHVIQDMHRARTTDAEQQTRLKEVRTKNYEEKLDCLETKINGLVKENATLTQKLQQKMSEHPTLAAVKALTTKMTAMEELIRKQKRDTKKIKPEIDRAKKVLHTLESELPGHFHLIDEANAAAEQAKRIQEATKDKESEEITKQLNATLAQERNLQKLIEFAKAKVPADKLALLQTLAQERALQCEFEDLSNKINTLKEPQTLPQPEPNDNANEEASLIKAILLEIESLEHKQETLLREINDKHAENEVAQVEIEAIEEEFLTIQSENSRQTKQLVDAEETNLRLIGDKVKHNQINVLTQRKTEILAEKVSKMEQKAVAMEEVIKRGLKKISTLEEHVVKCSTELQNYRNAMDGPGTLSRDMSLFVESLKQKIEDNLKEMEKQRGQSGEAISILEGERAAGLRLSEDLELLRQQLDHWIANGEGEEAGQVEQQLNYYKKMINCSNCLERAKNCMITRCFHVFCRDCLSGNPKEKKCPKCSATFAERDLQNIYI